MTPPESKKTKQRTHLQHQYSYDSRRSIERDEMLMNGAADRAVRQVFAKLGVDVNSPHELEEFRQDMRFSHAARTLAGHGVLALVGAITTALAAAIWIGVVSAIRGGQ